MKPFVLVCNIVYYIMIYVCHRVSFSPFFVFGMQHIDLFSSANSCIYDMILMYHTVRFIIKLEISRDQS